MSFDKRAFWQDLLTNKTPPKATAFLGFELIAFDPDAGWVEAAFTLPEHATNPGGDAQGGFVSAMPACASYRQLHPPRPAFRHISVMPGQLPT